MESKKIIDLSTHFFPVGTKAWHPKHRICYVVISIGGSRLIKSMKLGTLDMIWDFNTVHVNELRKKNVIL